IEIEIFTGPLSYEFSFIGPNGEIDSGEADEQLKTYSNLGPGQYTFTLIDVNGCPINQTCEVILSDPLVCTIGQVSHIDCNNLTGSVIINASGGSGVYRYSLDGQNFQVDNEFTGLSAGTHTLYVMDMHGTEEGCVSECMVTILQDNAEPHCDTGGPYDLN